jgi:hypothetical protein
VLQKTSYGSAEVISLDKKKLLDELRSIFSDHRSLFNFDSGLDNGYNISKSDLEAFR